MTAKPDLISKPRRGWAGDFRAFGRAHRKASAQMETSMPLLRHLDELRKRVFKAFAAVIVGVGVSFAFTEQAINYLASPIGGSEALVSIEVTENIAVYMRVALLGGVILGMPVILYQAMRFILPGLQGREKLWLMPVLRKMQLYRNN